MTTMRRAGIAELKARLSEFLRYVKKGQSVTVYDRDTPVARLVPLDASDLLSSRPPTGEYPSLQAVPLPAPLSVEIDVVELLREERQAER